MMGRTVSDAILHVVILGGGFGGLYAARALAGTRVRVTLVDRHNHHVFQPLLYQVATASLSPGDIASPIRWILRRQERLRVLLGEVQSVDVGRRHVMLDSGGVDYDFLIVATGARHTYFGHDEWAGHAPGLKTLDDALTMRRRVLLAFEKAEREADPASQRRWLTFVVVGGGPTGVELAGALAEIARHTLENEFRSIHTNQARIVLIESGQNILDAFPESLRAAAEADLVRLGVQVHKGTPVTAIDATGVEAGGARIEAGTVLWAAGVRASPVGASLGAPLDRAGRVIVQPDLSLPDHPEVFVVGDLASFQHQGGRPLPGVAQVAMQGGRHAARMIRATLEGQPKRPFKYVDPGSMATIGRGSAVADFGRFTLKGLPAWLAWLFVHIFNLIGFRNRLVVMIQWAWSYLTYQRNVRLITGRDADRG
jgi:NADH dehydrogenase